MEWKYASGHQHLKFLNTRRVNKKKSLRVRAHTHHPPPPRCIPPSPKHGHGPDPGTQQRVSPGRNCFFQVVSACPPCSASLELPQGRARGLLAQVRPLGLRCAGRAGKTDAGVEGHHHTSCGWISVGQNTVRVKAGLLLKTPERSVSLMMVCYL